MRCNIVSTREVLVPRELAHHLQPVVEVGDQVIDLLQPDVQPHHGAVEFAAARCPIDKTRGRQRQAFEAAPGRADAEQFEFVEEGVDEEASIERVARKKLRSLSSVDPPTRKRRLFSFLARRGYDSDAISRVLRIVLEHSESS